MTNPTDHPEFYGTCKNCNESIYYKNGSWKHDATSKSNCKGGKTTAVKK